MTSEDVLFTKSAIIVILALAIIFFVSNVLIDYYGNTNKKSTLISFKDFKNIIIIAGEDSWKWEDDDIYYHNEILYIGTNQLFRFNFIDYHRFKKFKKEFKRNKELNRLLDHVGSNNVNKK